MKYFLITYGCQMNKSDSERLESLLLSLGFQKASQPKQADLIILNTCSVRQTAEDRVLGQIQNFLKIKKKKPHLLIGVTGCLPGYHKNKDIPEKFQKVDLWFPIEDLPNLPILLCQKWNQWPAFQKTKNIILNQNLPDQIKNYFEIEPLYQKKFQAFLPIQTGCNQFCTYCIVPFARGQEKSRPLKDILKEAKSLADNGCLEITLLGQTVNHYQAPDPQNFSKNNPYKNHFAALLWELNQIAGLQRIHFTAPHPLFMTQEVIDALNLPKQVNYLHLPVQSGDNTILKKMNRKYTRSYYLKLIEKIRQKKPNIALGTDIIVGFPGETEKQFLNTYKLYQEVQFDIAYIAMYSPRPNTLAQKKFPDDIPYPVKKDRWQKLHELMEKITSQKNQKYLGQKVEVLVEDKSKNRYLGHSKEMKQVSFPLSKKENLIGKIISVEITQALTWELRGKRTR